MEFPRSQTLRLDSDALVAEELEKRRTRFRVLVCINGQDSSYEGLKLAAELGRKNPLDVVLLYVRRVDQGLNSGGLQVRVARQNMLDWGLELPGIQYLKRGHEILLEHGFGGQDWVPMHSHTDVFGDPLGDNKIEFRSGKNRRIILKLKIAPTVTSGILDQYELGPYNLVILGPPKRWSSGLGSFTHPSTVEKAAKLSPCSVLTVKKAIDENLGILICTDGTDRSTRAMRQSAVFASSLGRAITIMSIAPERGKLQTAERRVRAAKLALEKMGIEKVDTMTAVGKPAEEIVAVSDGFGMVIVADSGQSRLMRFLRGSTAFDVMHHAGTSVMVVR